MNFEDEYQENLEEGDVSEVPSFNDPNKEDPSLWMIGR